MERFFFFFDESFSVRRREPTASARVGFCSFSSSPDFLELDFFFLFEVELLLSRILVSPDSASNSLPSFTSADLLILCFFVDAVEWETELASGELEPAFTVFDPSEGMEDSLRCLLGEWRGESSESVIRLAFWMGRDNGAGVFRFLSDFLLEGASGSCSMVNSNFL